ncbi:hypothetical protein GCM10025870_28080 [Agromyces marinus]|uniref:AAA domain-containing protein n=1 Tax=Agromyces marinus TaxID=1389020 RepID=A0ABM8H4K4_9MICO|nr:hypothetical protein GCM10025870_28080 [Agromyces marinus]
MVKTLPGTGGTQTIVNAIGALVANDRRVLVVGARRASLDGIAHRLEQVRLGGLAVGTERLRRDLIASITRNEKVEQPRIADVDDALVRLRRVLLDYRHALTRKDPELGVSVLDALTALAGLASMPTPPDTTARLDRSSLVALATGRRPWPPTSCVPRRSASSGSVLATRPGTVPTSRPRRPRRPRTPSPAG